MTKNNAIGVWVVLLLSFGMTGCGTVSPAVTFYTLSPLSVAGQGEYAMPVAPAIGVGPVDLPDYLDRPQLVTRTGDNQMRIDEYHRWAGALDQEIVRVVTQNLMTLLSTDRIMAIPWPGEFNPGIVVRLDVFAFESAADGSARLRATVALSDRRKDSSLITWRADLNEPAASRSREEQVAAQSRLLERLSRQIAEKIAKMANGDNR